MSYGTEIILDLHHCEALPLGRREPGAREAELVKKCASLCAALDVLIGAGDEILASKGSAPYDGSPAAYAEMGERWALLGYAFAIAKKARGEVL